MINVRDKHTCQICGDWKYVEVHHKDGNHKNNDPINLITLCPFCHKNIGRTKIVAVVSGGLDSTIFAVYCAEVLKAPLYVISFTYGQRCTKEIERAKEILGPRCKEFKVIDISGVKELLGKNQLTDKSVKVENKYAQSVVVPVRNVILLSMASAWAYSINANYVIYGAHMSDSGGYPDCTPSFQREFQETIYTAHYHINKKGYYLDNTIVITSPAKLGMHKTELIKLGYKHLKDNIFRTWSCYKDGKKQCGRCESCRNRKKAFELSEIEDKTEYIK